MYFVGIDISKFKHDCFITTESGEFIINSFSIKNNNDGFQELLSVLKSLDSWNHSRNKNRVWSHCPLCLKPETVSWKTPLQLYGIQSCSSCEVQQISNFTTYQNRCYRLLLYCSMVNDSRIQTLFSWILSYIFTQVINSFERYTCQTKKFLYR